jgi:protein phosphatase
VSLRIAEHAERSDTGRVRSSNEDSFLVRAPLFVVADGMGGANAGEIASRTAVEVFAAGLQPGDDPESRLAETVATANSQIHRASQSDTARRGMGTTATAVLVGDGTVAVAHVGDSRAYLLRAGKIAQLTRDHTLVDELVREGRLTPEQAAEHPQRSIITRALGPEPHVEVDTFSEKLEEGDVLLLCSDGLTGMVSDDLILTTVSDSRSLAAAAKSLIRKANEAGGRDNITVVLIRIRSAMPGLPQSRTLTSRPAAGGAAGGGRTISRRSRVFAAAGVAIVLFAAAAGWRASRSVFFLGTDSAGVVTVYRGLPYDLPLGLSLYERWYNSGVPASVVSPARQVSLFDHTLRSKRDAANLVSSLEQGTVQQ